LDYRKILVGYDGSDNSKRALDRAVALSKREDAVLKVVVVVKTILPGQGSTAPYYPPKFAETVMQEGKQTLERALTQAKAAGIKVSGSVVDGHPAEALLQEAEAEGSDVIVLGRRGISGMERFLMGSVSSSVADHSKCDVLIVK
jgi:nucleotide-binding universal stress UspA family protein